MLLFVVKFLLTKQDKGATRWADYFKPPYKEICMELTTGSYYSTGPDEKVCRNRSWWTCEILCVFNKCFLTIYCIKKSNLIVYILFGLIWWHLKTPVSLCYTIQNYPSPAVFCRRLSYFFFTRITISVMWPSLLHDNRGQSYRILCRHTMFLYSIVRLASGKMQTMLEHGRWSKVKVWLRRDMFHRQAVIG